MANAVLRRPSLENPKPCSAIRNSSCINTASDSICAWFSRLLCDSMHMAAIQCRMVANLKSKNHPIMDNNLHLYLDIPLNKIEYDKSYFRRTLMEAVSIVAFLSFVSSSPTFSQTGRASCRERVWNYV